MEPPDVGAARQPAVGPLFLLLRRHPRGSRPADYVQRRGLDGALLRQVHGRHLGPPLMSIATLLTFPTTERSMAAWAFDHQQEHQKLVAQMGEGATGFTLINYLLDPIPPDTWTSSTSLWDMNHQQAHDDAANWFGVQPSLTLIDSPTQQSGPLQWFLFINSQEHNALNQAAIVSGHV
jgi:hypothetical protein